METVVLRSRNIHLRVKGDRSKQLVGLKGYKNGFSLQKSLRLSNFLCVCVRVFPVCICGSVSPCTGVGPVPFRKNKETKETHP